MNTSYTNKKFIEICNHQTIYDAAQFINQIGFEHSESEMKSLFSYGLNVFDEFLWHMINALVWLKKANDESPDNVKSIIELYPPGDEKTEIHHYLDKTELKLYNDIYHNAFSSFYTDHYDDGYHLDFSCRHPFFSETAYNFSLSHIVKDVPSDLFDDCCAWLNYIKNDSILYPDGLLEFAFTKYPENILLLVCNGPYKGTDSVELGGQEKRALEHEAAQYKLCSHSLWYTKPLACSNAECFSGFLRFDLAPYS